MADQAVFKRYELKYMLTQEQKQKVLAAMEPYMKKDKYGESTIRNIYFDTGDYILARHSIAKPEFKEKLRIRSYSRVDADGKVFVELKRKYDGVVYKRRVALPEAEAMAWTTGAGHPVADAGKDGAQAYQARQMTSEIDYFLSCYKGIRPALYLSYDREAYRMRDDSGFRVTFDENILARDYDMSLRSEAYGEHVLEPGKVLMELKCPGSIPMWMVKVLSEEHIYKTSFSKYGTAYKQMLLPAAAAAAMQAARESAVCGTAPQAAGNGRERAARRRSSGRAPKRQVFGRLPQRATA